MSSADTLREIITVATSELQHLESRPRGDKPLALDIAARLFPSAHLYASQAKDGRWHYYLTMPRGWEPAEGTTRLWMHNYNQGYYWDSGTGVDTNQERWWDIPNTEQQALVAGLKRLLDVL